MSVIVQYDFGRGLLFTALAAAPAVFERLLDGLTEGEADSRPDPERFTIREAIAHLAEWELVFAERLQLTLADERPTLPLVGGPKISAAHARSIPVEQLEVFRERRADTLDLLSGLSDDQWTRNANMPGSGLMTLEGQSLMIPLHDAYHAKQIADWRRLFGPCCPG